MCPSYRLLTVSDNAPVMHMTQAYTRPSDTQQRPSNTQQRPSDTQQRPSDNYTRPTHAHASDTQQRPSDIHAPVTHAQLIYENLTQSLASMRTV